MMPIRIQLKRTKGWNLQELSQFENGLPAVKVTRPTKYGNPFKIGCIPSQFSTALPDECQTIESVIECYRYFAGTWMDITGGHWVDDLRGKNLACFCKLTDPCHADVLLELANKAAK